MQRIFLSILGTSYSNGGSNTPLDLYLGGSRIALKMYSPSKSLGESIRNRLKQRKLIGSKGSISTSCNTKRSQAHAVVDAIRDDPLLKDMILRDVSPMTCTDLGPKAQEHSFTNTVSSCGIPFLASLLLLPNDDGKF